MSELYDEFPDDEMSDLEHSPQAENGISDDNMSDVEMSEALYLLDTEAVEPTHQLPQSLDGLNPLTLDDAIIRVRDFANEFRQLSDEGARKEAMRRLAQSMPTNLFQDDLDTINLELEGTLSPDLRPHRNAFYEWDNHLPPPTEYALIPTWQARVRDFALFTVAPLNDIADIADACAVFAPSVSDIPWRYEYKLQSVLRECLSERLDFQLISLTFSAFTTRENGVVYSENFPETVREQILLARPDFVWLSPEIPTSTEFRPGLFFFQPQIAEPASDESIYVASNLPGAANANVLVDLLEILCSLHRRFDNVVGILEEETNSSIPMPNVLCQISDEVSDVLEDCQRHATSPETVALPLTQKLTKSIQTTARQVATQLGQLEDQLIALEASWLAESETQFKATASLFERAKWRHAFKTRIQCLKTKSLRTESPYKPTVLRRLPYNIVQLQSRPYDQEHEDCPICSEEWDEDATTQIVTLCCKRPFHLDCYFTWIFGSTPVAGDEAKTCAMCRTEISDEFLSEILEHKVKQYNNL